MADPSSGTGPYECCGPMTAIHDGDNPLHRETVAYFCEVCGVWRHALRISDPRRVQIEARMNALVRSRFGGQR